MQCLLSTPSEHTFPAAMCRTLVLQAPAEWSALPRQEVSIMTDQTGGPSKVRCTNHSSPNQAEEIPQCAGFLFHWTRSRRDNGLQVWEGSISLGAVIIWVGWDCEGRQRRPFQLPSNLPTALVPFFLLMSL
jgi:hypothetical protein